MLLYWLSRSSMKAQVQASFRLVRFSWVGALIQANYTIEDLKGRIIA